MSSYTKALVTSLLALTLSVPLLADDGPTTPPASAPASQKADVPPTPEKMPGEKPSITTAKLLPAGFAHPIDYTATTGYMPLKDEHGKLRANVFYIAYTKGKHPEKPASTEPSSQPTSEPSTLTSDSSLLSSRPITFIFNGGPGAASVWLHLGAAGPRRVDMPEDGSTPVAPYKIIDNQYSWLPASDLVFVDPVNTGYSRAATPEIAKEFFGVREDVTGMGEFIRLYLTKYERWNSPIYLAGESYGTTRAAGLSDYLQERLGAPVTGVILISTVLNFAILNPDESNDPPYAVWIPSYAAVAWYHHKLDMRKYRDLDPLLKEAETFATNEYSAALMKGTAISDAERYATAKRLAELTGLTENYILLSNLRVPPQRFQKELLRSHNAGGGEQSLVVGRFDGRLTGFPTDPANDSQEYDPSLNGFYTAYTAAFNTYVRGTLKYENDFSYEVLSNRVYPWNWRSGGEDGFVYVGNHLRDAMTHNPHLKLLVCAGHFDLATPYFAADYQINHMTLTPDIRKNITQTYYPGGHMLYHVRSGLEKLYNDVTTFYKQSDK